MNTQTMREHFICSGNNCFENNYFDDNFKNGIITHASYKGLSIEQNPNILYKFDKLIKEINPTRVLEIGTFHGGLTLIIKDLMNLNSRPITDIRTYDVSSPDYVIERLNSEGINYVNKNLFSQDYQSFRDNLCEKELSDFIKGEGVTLILCDGGSKKNEFRLISSFLKEGDVIMAHDYAPNETFFKEKMMNRFWNWMEIQNSDIEECSELNNLHDFMRDEFINVGWVCKIKK
jgi:hypothetical protein